MFKRLRENRRYMRHEMNVPIEIVSISAASSARESVDVSYGGLAFLVDQLLYEGEIIQLRMPTVVPPFAASARVAFCRLEGVHYRVGVEFLDARDADRSQMVEQVCAVEKYRRDAMKAGRRLTVEEAARELRLDLTAR